MGGGGANYDQILADNGATLSGEIGDASDDLRGAPPSKDGVSGMNTSNFRPTTTPQIRAVGLKHVQPEAQALIKG